MHSLYQEFQESRRWLERHTGKIAPCGLLHLCGGYEGTYMPLPPCTSIGRFLILLAPFRVRFRSWPSLRFSPLSILPSRPSRRPLQLPFLFVTYFWLQLYFLSEPTALLPNLQIELHDAVSLCQSYNFFLPAAPATYCPSLTRARYAPIPPPWLTRPGKFGIQSAFISMKLNSGRGRLT